MTNLKTKIKYPTEKQMQKLSKLTGLNFDGGDNNHLFNDHLMYVQINESFTEKMYDKMEKQIEQATIKRKNYTVYAGNDESGYNYWKGDTNYISIAVVIETNDIDSIDIDQLKDDVERVGIDLCHWDDSQ